MGASSGGGGVASMGNGAPAYTGPQGMAAGNGLGNAGTMIQQIAQQAANQPQAPADMSNKLLQQAQNNSVLGMGNPNDVRAYGPGMATGGPAPLQLARAIQAAPSSPFPVQATRAPVTTGGPDPAMFTRQLGTYGNTGFVPPTGGPMPTAFPRGVPGFPQRGTADPLAYGRGMQTSTALPVQATRPVSSVTDALLRRHRGGK